MPFVKRHRTYYKYGTELNATVVGSFARIDKGVASGFSASNYLEVTNSFDVSGGKTWEMVYKVTTGSNVTTYQSICGHESTTSNYDPVSIAITTSSKFALTVCNSSSSDLTEDLAGSHTVTANTTYFVKLFFDGSKYVLSYSLDGVDYTEDVSYTSSTSIWTSNLILGRQESSASSMYPWLGIIDLSQSYININGERWWSGDSYTKVGSWIDDGVVSGFSASNYLKLPETFAPSANTWEMYFKVTPTSVTTQQSVVGQTSVSCGGIWLGLGRNSTNVFDLALGSGTSEWNISNHTTGTKPIEANTEYDVKVTFDGSAYNVYVNDELDISVTSSTAISAYTNLVGLVQTGGNTNAYPWLGSIDLNQSYIKVNNKDWWHGTKAVETTKDDADYHVDNNKLYQLAAVKRSYWKYDYQDWTQPILTSDTSSSKISLSSTGTYSGNDMYKAFDSDEGSGWLSTDGSGKGSLYISFPNVLKISSITVKGWSNPNGYTKTITIYKDKDNTEVVGDTHTYNGNGTYTWVFNEPILTDFLSFYSVGSGEWGCIGNIKIDAQEQIVVAGTSTDYDYYTDKLLSYEILNPNNYYTFTINPDKEDAIVTINGQVRNSIRLIKNSRITWSVSAEGYATQSGVGILTENTVLDIYLKKYAVDEVVFESNTAGTYDIELLEDGTYEVYVVGAGGGGSRGQSGNSTVNAGGGSGGYSNALMLLSAGHYSAVVGTGGTAALFGYPDGGTAGHGSDSSFDTLVAGGGKGGHSGSGAYGGAGGTGTTLNGNTGQAGGGRGVIAGGDSVYGGYGAGGAAQYSVGQWPGGAGYVKIVYKG